MTDENEQAAGSAAAEGTTAPSNEAPASQKPEAGQQAPEGQQEQGTEDDDDEQADDGQQKKSRSAERREARKRADAAKDAELAFWRSQSSARGLTLEQRIGKPPNPADYRDQVSYAAALAAHNTLRQGAASAMAAEKTQADEIQAMRAQAREARAGELEWAFKATAADYDQTVQRIANVTVPQAALDAIAESDLRPQLMYHLGKNPATAASLSQMTPVQAVKFVGSLEARLSTAPAQRSTQAPAPLTRIATGGAAPPKSIAEMNMDEYVAHRNAELKRA